MKSQFFFLRPDVITTPGTTRGLIVDLAKNSFFLVPNSLIKFISINNKKRVSSIIKRYSQSEQKVVEEYLNWLVGEGFALLCSNENFVKNVGELNKTWSSPFSITNCILEVSKKNQKNANQIVKKLSLYKIPFLELRIFHPIEFSSLSILLSSIQKSEIKHVCLIIKYANELEFVNIKKEFKFLTVIYSVNIFSAPYNKTFQIQGGTTLVSYRTESLQNSCCGKVDVKYFRPNLEFYTEASRYNSCLNRKISIDDNGEIRNCPSMLKSFGNINNTSLDEVITKHEFKKVWTITKDRIATCKVCEFRDICQDCRAYLQSPSDIYSKPLKCGYDPYTGKWEDWSINPLSFETIKFYAIEHIK